MMGKLKLTAKSCKGESSETLTVMENEKTLCNMCTKFAWWSACPNSNV